MNPLKTISKAQKIRLQKLGATVTDTMVIATEDQLWRAPIVGQQRNLLAKRGCLTIDTGGGGGGAYVAKAGQFDGKTAFTTSALLNGAVSATGTFFVWQKIAFADININTSYLGNGTDDQSNGQTANFYLHGPTSGPLDLRSSRGPVFQVNTSDGNTNVLTYATENIADDTWRLLAMSWDVNHASGARDVQILTDGVLRTVTFYNDDDPAFELDWLTPLYFTIGAWRRGNLTVGNNPAEGWIGGLSDFFFDIHNKVDLSDPVALAKIIDGNGKPVSLGPTGSLLTGQQPLIYLGGVRTNYHDNLGNGGAFSLVRGRISFTGSAGPGACVLADAQVGQAVVFVYDATTAVDYVNADFEATISVAGQIQQLAATDHSGDTMYVMLSGGSVPSATTSPSD